MKQTLNTYWKDWCWNSSSLTTRYEESTQWKRLCCWERLRAGGEGGNRGWDGWMASPTRTQVWANSRRQWWTAKPSVLQSMGSQRVRHDVATESQQQSIGGMFWNRANWQRQRTFLFCYFFLGSGSLRKSHVKTIFESVLMRWMKLEPIIQSEVSQKEKHQYSILTHIYGI